MRAQAGNDVVDVFDGEHDAPYAQRVRRCVPRLRAGRHRAVELRQLEPAVAVWGPHHRDLDPDAVEPDDAVHPTALDWHLDLQPQTELDKEGDSSLEVVDDNADVIHPPKRHAPRIARACAAGQSCCRNARSCAFCVRVKDSGGRPGPSGGKMGGSSSTGSAGRIKRLYSSRRACRSGALLSWKYGAVWAMPRSCGTSKPSQSMGSPLMSERPGSTENGSGMRLGPIPGGAGGMSTSAWGRLASV